MSSKPIKRIQALMPLSREHHHDLLLVWKLRKGLKAGVSPTRMAAYLQYVNDALIAAHFIDEETLLFDQLPDGDVLCNKARAQHTHIRWLIQQITVEKNEAIILFTQLADLIEAHVRYEERELFPYLEKRLLRRFCRWQRRRLMQSIPDSKILGMMFFGGNHKSVRRSYWRIWKIQ